MLLSTDFSGLVSHRRPHAVINNDREHDKVAGSPDVLWCVKEERKERETSKRGNLQPPTLGRRNHAARITTYSADRSGLV